jgi:predicted secreted hydrolase
MLVHASAPLDPLAARLGRSAAVRDGSAQGAKRFAASPFPRDFGAHPEARIEWWYATGALQAAKSRYGFQITFFRAATGVAERHPSRFAANQLVFAHAR